MSWEALHWAGKQRTRAASTQVVLYVLANAADPDGVAFRWWGHPNHWWGYLVRRTRLKRASLFRILAELEELGLIERGRGQTKGGPHQPIITLIGVEPCSRDETDAYDDESISETDNFERDTFHEGPKSTIETGATSGEHAAEAASLRPSPSHGPPSLYNPTNPETNPKPLSSAEPIGFRSWFESYVGWQTMDRAMAVREYTKLSEAERDRAFTATALYLADCARMKKPSRGAHLFLRKRLFNNYGSGSLATAAGPRTFVAEGTPQWQAWINAFAAAYGGEQRVPSHLGPHAGGFLRLSEWPPGGERWNVPREHWVFLEHGTARHRAWCERIASIFNRTPLMVRASASFIRDHHRRLGSKPDNSISRPDAYGLFVPLEWPPAKGEPPKPLLDTTGPPLGELTDEDAREFINSS